jgi:hypothetical protein
MRAARRFPVSASGRVRALPIAEVEWGLELKEQFKKEVNLKPTRRPIVTGGEVIHSIEARTKVASTRPLERRPGPTDPAVGERVTCPAAE